MLYDKKWEAKKTKTNPNPNLQSWRVILLLAADELEKTGWCQGAFARQRRGKIISHCALGAIRAVGAGQDLYMAETELENALNLPIVSWNDHPSNTEGNVIAKLREVAMAKIEI